MVAFSDDFSYSNIGYTGPVVKKIAEPVKVHSKQSSTVDSNDVRFF